MNYVIEYIIFVCYAFICLDNILWTKSELKCISQKDPLTLNPCIMFRVNLTHFDFQAVGNTS